MDGCLGSVRGDASRLSTGENEGLALGEHPGGEALRFRDPLDLERDGVQRVHDRGELECRLRFHLAQLRGARRAPCSRVAADPRADEAGRQADGSSRGKQHDVVISSGAGKEMGNDDGEILWWWTRVSHLRSQQSGGVSVCGFSESLLGACGAAPLRVRAVVTEFPPGCIIKVEGEDAVERGAFPKATNRDQ
jgi:hypothetical protein